MARLYEIAEDCVRKTSFFRNFSPSDLDTKTATNKFVEYILSWTLFFSNSNI